MVVGERVGCVVVICDGDGMFKGMCVGAAEDGTEVGWELGCSVGGALGAVDMITVGAEISSCSNSMPLILGFCKPARTPTVNMPFVTLTTKLWLYAAR